MSDYTWVPVKVIKTTPGALGAVLVDDENGHKAWIPRSQINDWTTKHGDELDDSMEGHDVELEMTTWIAQENELI